MSLYNELPIVFPWYEKIEHQDRYRENVNGICAFKLISPKNSLLPFQFRKVTTGEAPSEWIVLRLDDNSTVADISASIADIVFSSKIDWDYFTFPGTPITGLDLAPGFYFSVLIFPDDTIRFSEVFFVPDTSQAFDVQDAEIQFIKIEFYNNSDIAPIFYDQENPLGGSFFKQVVYLDTFITASEPELTVDGTKDGNDELIPTFQKVVINYRITIDAGEYLKKALAVMPMHDVVTLTTKQNVRNGELEKLAVDSVLEGNGAISIVDIVFQDTIAMIKKGCDSPITSACVGDPTRLNSIVDGTPDTNYLFTGYAPPGTSVQLYGSNTLSGPKYPIAGAVTSYADFVAGVQFAKDLFVDYEFVSAKAASTGCDFGFSVPLDKAPLPAEGLILIFTAPGAAPVADRHNVSQWNTFFDTLSNADSFFTDVLVDDGANSVTLYGASNLYIKDSLFQGTNSLVRMLDPGGVVTTVGYNTFNTCTNLVEVNMPGCLRINGNGFLNAFALAVINFPRVTFIDQEAFADTIITSADFPECITIGFDAFDGCTALVTANIPQCTSLGDYAFAGCTALTTVVSPLVPHIGLRCFDGCGALTTVDVSSVLSVGERGFEGCFSLVSIIFPICTTFDIWVFKACSALQSVSAPVATAIGQQFVFGCTALVTCYLPLCTDLGGTTGDDFFFFNISGNNVHLTVPTSKASDGDVLYLQANNTVTLTLV